MNRRIIILALAVIMLAMWPQGSAAKPIAKDKDKPCMVIGQVKDYLTHVLIDGAKVTLLTRDGVPVDSGRSSKNQTSSNLTTVYWVTAKTCDMPEMLLRVEAEGYEPAVVTLPAKKVHGRGSKGVRYVEDVLLKRQPKTIKLNDVVVKATKVKFYHNTRATRWCLMPMPFSSRRAACSTASSARCRVWSSRTTAASMSTASM